MKKTFIFLFILFSPLMAAVIPTFNCNDTLSMIEWDGINWGSYQTVILNMPDKKTDVDDSVIWKIGVTMTNQTAWARTLSTSATNNNINVPQWIWDYLNTH